MSAVMTQCRLSVCLSWSRDHAWYSHQVTLYQYIDQQTYSRGDIMNSLATEKNLCLAKKWSG